MDAQSGKDQILLLQVLVLVIDLLEEVQQQEQSQVQLGRESISV